MRNVLALTALLLCACSPHGTVNWWDRARKTAHVACAERGGIYYFRMYEGEDGGTVQGQCLDGKDFQTYFHYTEK